MEMADDCFSDLAGQDATILSVTQQASRRTNDAGRSLCHEAVA
jgi:hypothetical protein